MATFLTTRKMARALAARVEASVRGRRPVPGTAFSPRIVSALRFVTFTALACLFGTVAFYVRQTARQLDRDHAKLVEDARREAATLARRDLGFVEHVEAILRQAAGVYTGDSVSDEIRGDLAHGLLRPMVYVRGPVASFDTDSGIFESASESSRDVFVRCLFDPPSSRSEKAVLSKVRRALREGDEPLLGGQVERLRDALVGLPFLEPEWQSRARAATARSDVDELRAEFARAPIAAAERAARSTLLLFVMDEPNDRGAPTELDGEAPHDVRVELWNLSADRELFRLRRHVDPAPIAPAVRAQLAGAMDSCALALDVVTDVSATPIAGGQ